MLKQRSEKLKKRLSDGETISGIWISIQSPVLCEIVADAGFDFVIVDAEHSMFNPETLIYMHMAFNTSTTVPIIRVPSNNNAIIKQVLDSGFEGILVPNVDTAQQAKDIVDMCLYPPLGNRGYGPRRVSNYYKQEKEYVDNANESIICAIQAESKTAVDNIDKIVKVPGIDWLIVGPNDMSKTVGKFRDLKNPDLHESIRKVVKAAHNQKLATGVGNIDISESMSLGCQLTFLGEDIIFLRNALDNALENFHETVKKVKDK